MVDKNLHRRHLSTGQRAMIANEFAKLKSGQNVRYMSENAVGEQRVATAIPKEIAATTLTMPEAAALFNVSTNSITRARAVQELGTPEEIAAVA